jgi:hypothetical protein
VLIFGAFLRGKFGFVSFGDIFDSPNFVAVWRAFLRGKFGA